MARRRVPRPAVLDKDAARRSRNLHVARDGCRDGDAILRAARIPRVAMRALCKNQGRQDFRGQRTRRSEGRGTVLRTGTTQVPIESGPVSTMYHTIESAWGCSTSISR